jgi:predicted NAD-dependent protein-ADP-ribosyltransferase YbiA (DUF1768 family)
MKAARIILYAYSVPTLRKSRFSSFSAAAFCISGKTWL